MTTAVNQGLDASLSTPITAAGATIGVTNLYALKPHTFTVEERARATAYTEQAAAAIAIATRLAHHTQLTDDLRAALVSVPPSTKHWALSWVTCAAVQTTPSPSCERPPKTPISN